MKKSIQLMGLAVVLFLFACSKPATKDFQHLVVPNTPTYCLACPDKYCNITPNIISPVYSVSAADLYDYFNRMVSKNSDINFVYDIPEQGQFGLVAYSPVFRFPDDITIQFIALSESTSTVAVYSQSRYGFYDFGMNKRRLENWLAELKNATQANAVQK
jgi:hypothetical protein